MGTVPKGGAISLAVGTDWDWGGLGSPHSQAEALPPCLPHPPPILSLSLLSSSWNTVNVMRGQGNAGGGGTAFICANPAWEKSG